MTELVDRLVSQHGGCQRNMPRLQPVLALPCKRRPSDQEADDRGEENTDQTCYDTAGQRRRVGIVRFSHSHAAQTRFLVVHGCDLRADRIHFGPALAGIHDREGRFEASGPAKLDRFPESGELGVEQQLETRDPGLLRRVVACQSSDLIQPLGNDRQGGVVGLQVPFVVREQEATLSSLGVLHAGQQLVERGVDLVGMKGFLVIVAQCLEVAVFDDPGEEEKDKGAYETDGDDRVQPRPLAESA